MSDFLTDYVEGWAQLIAGADIGFSWRNYGTQTDGRAPISIVYRPTSPDKMLALTPIPMDADPVYTDSRVDLQLWFRGTDDARSVWPMRSATRRLLAGRFPLRLPTGIYVSTVEFASGGSMGSDDSHRWMWADTWRTRASEPRT